MSDYIKQNGSYLTYKNSENWVILNTIESNIKCKIEKNGTKLSEWDLSINRGILTGYNDAFIINEATKNMLISVDSKSAELIRPILRGKDIKRYNYKFANLWLIYIPWHFPLQNDSSIKGASKDAEVEFKKQYPAIYSYLYGYKEKLSNRNKAETGIRYEWYALQRWGSKYSEDFSSQKLMYSEIVQEPHFYLDEGHFFPEATSFIISGSNLECLLFLLNSNITFALFKLFYAGGGLGDHGIRYKKAFLNDLRLPAINDENIVYFKDMYNNLNQSNMIVNKDIQKELDLYIGRLYGLSEEEINYLIQDL